MLISILIPVYNAEKYLKKTVKSVLNQDYPEIEIILFDDASKDGSREIMQDFSEKYPNKVFSYYTDENGGIGASKNAALNYSTGEYVFLWIVMTTLWKKTIFRVWQVRLPRIRILF